MNIFIHELKTYRKSTIIWTVALIGIASMYLFVYPAFAKDITGLTKLLEGYPEMVKKALGFTVNTFATLTGFYSLVITFVTLCGSIQSMNLGLSILSRETADKTADFLLTKPVSRVTIVTAKLLAALFLIVITNLIYLAATIMISSAVSTSEFSLKIFILISLILFFVQIMFMALGVLVSVLAKKIKSVISISLSTVFAFFIMYMFGSVLGEETIRYLTPFKYYDPNFVVQHAGYELRFAVIEVLFVIAAIATSYVVYSRKDIHAV